MVQGALKADSRRQYRMRWWPEGRMTKLPWSHNNESGEEISLFAVELIYISGT